MAVFDSFESQCKKFFEKESRVKSQRKEIIDQIEENEIMVRIETATNKQYSHFCGTPDFVEQTIKDTVGKYCLHEVIHGDKCKLFFDIDIPIKEPKIDVRLFDKKVRQFLQQNHFEVGDLKMTVSERLDTTVKTSYHIIYHVVMPITVVERIATRMQKTFKSVDLQVYTTKSLRLNGSLKFKKTDKTFDMTSKISSTDPFCDTLVSYTFGYPEIEEPIALTKTNVLNFSH